MLRPAVQPGSKLEHEFATEQVTLTIRSPSRVKVSMPGGYAEGNTAVFALKPQPGVTTPIEIKLATGGAAVKLPIGFTTNEDQRERPLPLRRFLLPWANTDFKALGKEPTSVRPPELAGGSWARGHAVFFSDAAACHKCHAVHGRGGDLGPSLSNLIHRDYASVLRDIAQPSFAINPDHLTHIVRLHDGRTLSGVVRTVGAKLRIGNNEGVVTEVAASAVERMAASAVSTMPDGLPQKLGPERMRDLMTFLLTDPVRMPSYGAGKPPAPRSRKEVVAALAGSPNPPAATKPIRIVLVSGRKDHGPGEHDYPAWKESWRELLGAAENAAVEVADEWPSAKQWESANVLVFYQQGKWTPERARRMDAFLQRGGGAVYIHYAVDGGADAPGFAQRIGLAWQGGRSKFRHGPLDLGFATGAQHPIGRNLGSVKFVDESYWGLVGDPAKVNVLATGKEDGQEQPLFWTLEPSGGRVFVSIPGHYAWTFDDPLFRLLILRGIAWSAKEPVDRFNPLATLGARLQD
jgi:putative heme-binding domain-containing protein